MALVDIPQSITVTDQRALPVIMEVVPAHGNPVASSNNITLAIVVIRAMIHIRGKLVVVNPNTSAVLDGDSVVVQNITNAQISDNDIGF